MTRAHNTCVYDYGTMRWAPSLVSRLRAHPPACASIDIPRCRTARVKIEDVAPRIAILRMRMRSKFLIDSRSNLNVLYLAHAIDFRDVYTQHTVARPSRS